VDSYVSDATSASVNKYFNKINKYHDLPQINNVFFHSFSKVYGQTATQSDIFEGTVLQHIASVMNGQNASILAYGSTGAGE
jgi:hypothetical protein